MSHCIRNSTICICEKGTDQLCSWLAADQCLCFHYTDSIITLLKSEISGLELFSVLVQPGLCQTWSEIQIVGFLMRRLILYGNR